MAITDYDTLQSAIADWLNRADLTSQIQTFIQLAESDLNTRLRTREMIVRAQATSDEEFVQLPTDWLEAINIQLVDGKSPLRYVSMDQADIIVARQEFTSVTFYSIMDSAIELVPAPSDDVEIEMVYYKKIPALSDTNTTNWLLTKAPDIYLYGALSHASPFIMDDQRMPMFAQLYLARTESLNDESKISTHSGGPLVARTRAVY
mgnify:FL=1|jgi:hypothetical protein